jgi:Uri superfamily endonuclease
VTELTAAWWLAAPERLEHRWALALARLPDCTIPMPHFGASDCRCPAHLLYLPALPAAAMMGDLLSASPSARPTLAALTGA